VYREGLSKSSIALPTQDMIMSDQDIGQMFGPGKYRVHYTWTDSTGKKCQHDERYQAGPEFAKVHREFCAAMGQPCYLDNMTVIPGFTNQKNPFDMSTLLNEGTLKSVIALVGLAKQIFGSQNDELLKYVLQEKSGKRGDISDVILTTALQQMSAKPNPLKDMREHLQLVAEIREMTGTGGEVVTPAAETKGEKMGGILGQVIEYLPTLLEAFGGNAAAAAAAQKKENPMVRAYLASPKAQKSFFDACTAKYGIDQAKQWALGFGLDPRKFMSQPAAAPQPTAPRPGVITL
jgi:hypothetical protein